MAWIKSAFLFASLSILFSCTQSPKIAYLNPVKLSQEYEAVKAEQAQLEAIAAPWRVNVDTLTAELQRATTRYEQQRAQLTPDQITAREQELANRQGQLAQYREATTQKLTAERERLDVAVVNELNTFLKEYGKREGYSVILGATSSGNIVYADEAMDVTAAVVKELNERYRRQHPNKK
jgi:outer membrane protein